MKSINTKMSYPNKYLFKLKELKRCQLEFMRFKFLKIFKFSIQTRPKPSLQRLVHQLYLRRFDKRGSSLNPKTLWYHTIKKGQDLPLNQGPWWYVFVWVCVYAGKYNFCLGPLILECGSAHKSLRRRPKSSRLIYIHIFWTLFLRQKNLFSGNRLYRYRDYGLYERQVTKAKVPGGNEIKGWFVF